MFRSTHSKPKRSGKLLELLLLLCWHFGVGVTPSDREYGLMSSSKIGLVKITCHESLHSSHDVQFLHKAAVVLLRCCHHQQQQLYLAGYGSLLSKAFNWRKRRKFAHVRSDSCQVQITITAMSSFSPAPGLPPTCILGRGTVLLTPRR